MRVVIGKNGTGKNAPEKMAPEKMSWQDITAPLAKLSSTLNKC
jgi:hypothetical protein